MEQEQLLKEMESGIFITIESPDRNLAKKVVIILETALKYEFTDKKFIIIDPHTCTDLAIKLSTYLQSELYGTTPLLLSSAIISEAANAIRSYLVNQYNVICTSYLTDMIISLAEYYDPATMAPVIQGADVLIQKSAEIVLMGPIEQTDSNITRLNSYHSFVSATMEDNEESSMHYRIDVTDDIDKTVKDVIAIIGSRLEYHDNLKNFAAKLFKEPDTSKNEQDSNDIIE